MKVSGDVVAFVGKRTVMSAKSPVGEDQFSVT